MTAFNDGAEELSRLLEQRWTILREEPPGVERLDKLHELDPLITQQARLLVKDTPVPGEITRTQRRQLKDAVHVLLELEDDLAALERSLTTVLGRLPFYHYHIFYEHMLRAVKYQRTLGRLQYGQVPIPTPGGWLDDEATMLGHSLRRLDGLRQWRRKVDEQLRWRPWSSWW